MMTHAGAFGQSAFEHVHERDEVRIRSCHEPLKFVRSSFHSDVQWEVYACCACNVEVYTVGGGSHWWNYETSPKTAST